MWPTAEKLTSDTEINRWDEKFSPLLEQFIESEKIDGKFKSSFKTVYLPLAKWIESKQGAGPVIIGINGAQGSGKSTLSKLLVMVLEKIFNKSVLHLSIDDLYLSRDKRLARASAIHPLLKVRGVPGTHNTDLGIEILKSIKTSSDYEIKLPVFDKVIDDLLPENHWCLIQKNIDIVLFEGWCVAAEPQTKVQLSTPVNLLEEKEDADCCWRSYVNKQLSDQYKEWFSYIDYLIMLKVPDMESVYEWRELQEKKLIQSRQQHNKYAMSEQQLKKFIMYFERITRQCLGEMPARADVLLNINKDHQITAINIKGCSK